MNILSQFLPNLNYENGLSFYFTPTVLFEMLILTKLSISTQRQLVQRKRPQQKGAEEEDATYRDRHHSGTFPASAPHQASEHTRRNAALPGNVKGGQNLGYHTIVRVQNPRCAANDIVVLDRSFLWFLLHFSY